MEMTQSRIAAVVATAFNIAAAQDATLRQKHQNGMSPATAEALPRDLKTALLEVYADRINRGEYKQHEPLLYGAGDAQAAIAALGVEP
jgi:hypothetical protein